VTADAQTRAQAFRLLVVAVGFLVPARVALAQGGPLTGTLREDPPPSYAVRLGPLLVNPRLTLHEAGVDTNVFDEATNPKKDYVATLTPDLQLYARMGLLRAVGFAATDFTYYHRYTSERSIHRQFGGRLDALVSRARPWVAAAMVSTRRRWNNEIDLRARRDEVELSGGVVFELTPIANLYVMGSQLETDFNNAQVFRDVNLDQALSRREQGVSGGLRIRATPFTAVTIAGGVSHDRFVHDRARDTDSRSAEARVEFSPEAVISGRAAIGFQDFQPRNPLVPGHRGIIGRGGLTYTLLGRATINTLASRSVQYSYEEAASYYLETGLDVTYTQRLVGPFDMQARAARQWMDYTDKDVRVPSRDPVVNAYQVGVGYSFQDTSRIGFNFEYAERVDEDAPDRRYNRRRVFGSYTYGFR